MSKYGASSFRFLLFSVFKLVSLLSFLSLVNAYSAPYVDITTKLPPAARAALQNGDFANVDLAKEIATILNTSPGTYFFPRTPKPYFFKTAVFIDKANTLLGEPGTHFTACGNYPTLQFGGDRSMQGKQFPEWNGHIGAVSGITMTRSDTCKEEGPLSFGIAIYGMKVDISNCIFSNRGGGGIFGRYVQYSRFSNNGFSHMPYGIKVETPNSDRYGSNDMIIDGNYQNDKISIAGMSLQIQQSRISSNTFTLSVDSSCGLDLTGSDNVILRNTFEHNSPLVVTLARVKTTSGLHNEIQSNTFQGYSEGRGTYQTTPLLLSGYSIVENNTFNTNAAFNGSYIISDGPYLLGRNHFSDQAYRPSVGNQSGIDKAMYRTTSVQLEDPIRVNIHGQHDYTTRIEIPEPGTWLISYSMAVNSDLSHGEAFQTGVFSAMNLNGFPDQGSTQYTLLTKTDNQWSSTSAENSAFCENGKTYLHLNGSSPLNGKARFVISWTKIGDSSSGSASR